MLRSFSELCFNLVAAAFDNYGSVKNVVNTVFRAKSETVQVEDKNGNEESYECDEPERRDVAGTRQKGSSGAF